MSLFRIRRSRLEPLPEGMDVVLTMSVPFQFRRWRAMISS
jgi:hypothetical protein